MKKTLYLVLAIALCISGCGKRNNDSTSLQTESSAVQNDSSQPQTQSDFNSLMDSSESGSGVRSQSSSENPSSQDKSIPKSSYKDLNEDDKKHVDSAKSLITDWFSYMSKAEYSKANTLCTEDFIKRFHFDKFTDGENVSKATAEFYDDALEVRKDSQGRIIISVKTKSVSQDSSKGSAYGIFEILYQDGAYLIANIDETDYSGN